MNSFTSNPTAAGFVAHQMIQERVQDAQRRAQVRSARAARRTARSAAREAARQAGTPGHHFPSAAFRFLHAAR